MIYTYTETQNGNFKKSAFEAVSYAKKLADMMGDSVTAIAFHASQPDQLGKYGAQKVVHFTDDSLKDFDPQTYAAVISNIIGDNSLVLSHSIEGSSIAPFIAIQKEKELITNVLAAPSSVSPLQVKRKAFSGKGIMQVECNASSWIITVLQNAYGVVESAVDCTVENATTSETPSIKVESREVSSGKIDLKEAEIVISAGRGLKSPENWGMIEELADLLGAATACSKPVSDIGWRPHSEHVGQTGKAIAPKLYIAIGISGAIQHLAGVNASKNIVVINIDAEAPFFQAADYGVVGDAFEVVPQFIEKIKAYKNS